MAITNAALVYQAGIANVFEVQSGNLSDFGRDAKRLLQSDFKTCAAFARGLAAAGVNVYTASCNKAGDIVQATWTMGLDDCPFHDSACAVYAGSFAHYGSDSNADRHAIVQAENLARVSSPAYRKAERAVAAETKRRGRY